MTPDELTRVRNLIRNEGSELIKTAGAIKAVGRTIKDVWGAARSGSEAAAKHLESKGFHPLISGATRYTPHAAVAYGGKKALESETAQKLHYKYRLWKARRAQKAAMRGYQ